MIRISISCRKCGTLVTMEAHQEDLQAWRDGALIQAAMPYLRPDQREMLMSRTCGECFDRMAKEWAELDTNN